MPVNRPKGKLSYLIMDVFNESIVKVGKNEAEAIAKEIAQTLKDRIRSNDFRFKHALSEDTLRRKEGAIPLYDTGDYINSIEATELADGWRVGVRDVMHVTQAPPTEQDSDEDPKIKKQIPMRELARTLEFGSWDGHIPPRPHWRPVIAKVLKDRERTRKAMTKKMRESATRRMREYNKERDLK